MKENDKNIELPFGEAIAHVETLPGQEQRLLTRRHNWKLRQRRSRANRRWAQRTHSEDAQLEAQARSCHAQHKHELTDERIEAINILFAAIQCGGVLAAVAAESATGADFENATLGLVWDTACALHARGLLVTRCAVVADLRRRGVLLFDGGALLDAAFACPSVPDSMGPGDIRHHSAILKSA